jgi:hypothetical protein
MGLSWWCGSPEGGMQAANGGVEDGERIGPGPGPSGVVVLDAGRESDAFSSCWLPQAAKRLQARLCCYLSAAPLAPTAETDAGSLFDSCCRRLEATGTVAFHTWDREALSLEPLCGPRLLAVAKRHPDRFAVSYRHERVPL